MKYFHLSCRVILDKKLDRARKSILRCYLQVYIHVQVRKSARESERKKNETREKKIEKNAFDAWWIKEHFCFESKLTLVVA